MTLVDTDRVTISELEFLRNVSILITHQSPRTLQNYMIWRFMMNQATYMPTKFRAIKLTFDQIFRGISSVPSRTIICARFVNDNMGLAVAKIYIRQYFDKNARNQVIQSIIMTIVKSYICESGRITYQNNVSFIFIL